MQFHWSLKWVLSHFYHWAIQASFVWPWIFALFRVWTDFWSLNLLPYTGRLHVWSIILMKLFPIQKTSLSPFVYKVIGSLFFRVHSPLDGFEEFLHSDTSPSPSTLNSHQRPIQTHWGRQICLFIVPSHFLNMHNILLGILPSIFISIRFRVSSA